MEGDPHAHGPLDGPHLEVMPEEECFRLLAFGGIGRLGFSARSLPVVLPVNYVLEDRDLFFCTGSGAVWAAAIGGDVACLEIDEYEALGHEGWSVMATGRLREVTGRDELDACARLPLTPWRALVDPHFVRLPVDLLSGRRLRVGT